MNRLVLDTPSSVAHVTGTGTGRFGTVAMTVTTVTALAAITVALWNGGALNGLICDGDCGVQAVRPPDALNVEPVDATLASATRGTATVDAAAVRAAVDDALDNREMLGPRVGFAAVDPQTGKSLYEAGSGALTPASTTKLLTAFTVLTKLDPQERFTTSVVRSGDELVLVGGGDPYLLAEPPDRKAFGAEADIETLAARTASALRASGVTDVNLDYNASSFAGPSFNPSWPESYTTEKIVTPISALWVDKGVVDGVRSDEPASAAAETFADALDDVGISVSDDHDAVSVPNDAVRVASVKSATVSRITERMIATSDNEAAEVLLRHAAQATGRPASFAGGVATVTEALRASGIDTPGLVLRDGSGLSRKNRIAPITLAEVVARATAQPRTASLVSDLPTANFSGSLDNRFFKEKDGRGVVRAKTGTLTDVHSLAGFVTDRLGTPIVFAVMVDETTDIPDLDAQAALDAVPAALARCSCSTRTVEP